MNALQNLAKQTFPDIDPSKPHLGVGSVPEWDSMAHFSFLLAVEERFGVRFSVEEIAELKTLAEIQSALLGKGASV